MIFDHPPIPRRPPVELQYGEEGNRLLEPPTAEQLLARSKNLWRERGIQRAGISFVGSAATVLLFGGAMILFKSGEPWQMADRAAALQVYWALGLLALLSLVLGFTGWGLQRFHPRSHAWGAIISVLLLPVIPYGTIVAGYFLYCLSGEQAAALFTPEYAAIRRATREMTPDYWLRIWYGVGVALPLMGCAMFDSFVK